MKYTFNIGLNNNNYSNAVMHINNAKGAGYFDNYHIREMQGSYNGVDEPTIVLTVDTKADVVSMTGLASKWCKAMNQICIAVEMTASEIKDTNYPETVNSSFGVLVYADSFRGHKSTFDSKYFLTNN